MGDFRNTPNMISFESCRNDVAKYSNLLDNLAKSIEEKVVNPNLSKEAIKLMASNEECAKKLPLASSFGDSKLADLFQEAKKSYTDRIGAENNLAANIINQKYSSLNKDIYNQRIYSQIENVKFNNFFGYRTQSIDRSPMSYFVLFILLVFLAAAAKGYLENNKEKAKKSRFPFADLGDALVGVYKGTKDSIDKIKKNGEE